MTRYCIRDWGVNIVKYYAHIYISLPKKLKTFYINIVYFKLFCSRATKEATHMPQFALFSRLQNIMWACLSIFSVAFALHCRSFVAASARAVKMFPTPAAGAINCINKILIYYRAGNPRARHYELLPLHLSGADLRQCRRRKATYPPC